MLISYTIHDGGLFIVTPNNDRDVEVLSELVACGVAVRRQGMDEEWGGGAVSIQASPYGVNVGDLLFNLVAHHSWADIVDAIHDAQNEYEAAREAREAADL